MMEFQDLFCSIFVVKLEDVAGAGREVLTKVNFSEGCHLVDGQKILCSPGWNANTTILH